MRFQFVDQTIGPGAEFVGIGIFQGVLELRPADTIFNAQILNGLHEKRDARHLCKLRLQPADHARRIRVPLVERLQVDLNASAVHRGIDTVDADERRQAGNGRVLQNDSGECLLPLRHRHERYRLRCLGNAQNDACILNGEEALRNRYIEQYCTHQRGESDKQRERLMLQNPLQSAAVLRDDPVEDMFGLVIEPVLLGFRLMAKQLGAHHRRQGQ